MRNQWYFECINRTLFRRQINFVTHGYLISFGLEFLFNIMNNLVFSDKFKFIEYENTVDTMSYIILFKVNLSHLIILFCNYIAFYFLVKIHFVIKKNVKSTETKITLEKKNSISTVGSKEINDFLKI